MRGQHHAPAATYPRKDPVLIVQEAGWASDPVWTGAENLAPTGIRSQDRPACGQSLYRLSYPGIKLYNKLPVQFKQLDNYKCFEREVKTFLLNNLFHTIEEFFAI